VFRSPCREEYKGTEYKGQVNCQNVRHRSMNRSFGFGPTPTRGGRDRPSSEHSMIGCLFWLVFCCKTLKAKKKRRQLGSNRPG
jgi:hypothetical protein